MTFVLVCLLSHMHWMKLWPFWRYESKKLLLWHKNEQLKLLSLFAYEVQIQRFKYLGVVFDFAILLLSFFHSATFLKCPVVKPSDKYGTWNSWFSSDILGVMQFFFPKPWRGDKLQVLSRISISIFSVLAYSFRKITYIYIYIYISLVNKMKWGETDQLKMAD